MTELAPASPPPATSARRQLDRVRATLSVLPTRRVLGWVLLVVWAGWLVALWVAQPRLVSLDFAQDELAQRHPVAYRVVTVQLDRGGRFSASDRVDITPVPDADLPDALDGTYSGPPVSVAYWVDSPVARLRVVDPNGLSSEVPAAIVEQLSAAGVPVAATDDLWRDPPAQSTYNAGALLVLLANLVVILGPRPRRGTRWFWFWVVGGPLSIGVPIFAAIELIRARAEPVGTVHPPGVAGRWNGLTGFLVGLLLSFGGAVVLIQLTDTSPIWFLRG